MGTIATWLMYLAGLFVIVMAAVTLADEAGRRR